MLIYFILYKLSSYLSLRKWLCFQVLHKKHPKVNGEEECECTFLLFWLHGPNVGEVAEKRVADICLVQGQGSELQPKLASFMGIAMEKIEKKLCNDLALNLVDHHRENSSLIVKQEPSFHGSLYQVTVLLLVIF